MLALVGVIAWAGLYALAAGHHGTGGWSNGFAHPFSGIDMSRQ